ncbi:hypothetical protein QJS66_18590 [Kocuria rhizophila]|nr:hypothetical protein QJS66_18590 [Kocuria rhizophila]
MVETPTAASTPAQTGVRRRLGPRRAARPRPAGGPAPHAEGGEPGEPSASGVPWVAPTPCARPPSMAAVAPVQRDHGRDADAQASSRSPATWSRADLGGPLLDADGQVVGVVFAKAVEGEAGYTIPWTGSPSPRLGG